MQQRGAATLRAMSTDWHVHCLDCNDTQTFDDANHREELMALLCRHAAVISALVPLIQDIGSRGCVALSLGSYGEVDPEWFAKHLGHRLVPINEYDEVLTRCPLRLERHDFAPCVRNYGHDGDCVVATH